MTTFLGAYTMYARVIYEGRVTGTFKNMTTIIIAVTEVSERCVRGEW